MPSVQNDESEKKGGVSIQEPSSNVVHEKEQGMRESDEKEDKEIAMHCQTDLQTTFRGSRTFFFPSPKKPHMQCPP